MKHTIRYSVLFIMIIICAVCAVSCSDGEVKKEAGDAVQVPTADPKATVAVKDVMSDNKKTTLKGIDVSSYSGDIDWKSVKSDGIDFAMIRVGGRVYGESGELYTDKKAVYNLTQARKNGIETGAYFFSQATSAKEAKEEAKQAVSSCAGRILELPISCDVERIKGDTSRIDNVSYADSVKFAKVFMKEIKKSGYEPMVYIGEDSILKAEDFKGYKIWYADYKKPYEKGYEILQYSKTGKVKGINADVDLDIMYK